MPFSCPIRCSIMDYSASRMRRLFNMAAAGLAYMPYFKIHVLCLVAQMERNASQNFT